jgi:threonine dehydrogenase-like Zn-dependent dehydrogenase
VGALARCSSLACALLPDAAEVPMRAMAVFPGKRELKLVEVPRPESKGEHDVTVDMREVGVCGTDREICGFHYGTPPEGSERLVLGHEGLGEVVDVGPAVRSLSKGDLVAIMVRRPCQDPSCVACRAGRQDFCITGHFRERGINQADGFMTERIVEHEHYLVRVPRALSDVGVLIEPLTIAAKASVELDAIMRRYPWEPTGLRALVLGAGPIGLLGAMMLVARNIETSVYSLEPADSDRARVTRSFGGEYISAGDTELADLPSRVGSCDVIFEAVGTAWVAFSALHALAANGVCILSGVPASKKTIEINLDGIMRDIVLKNQVVFGTVNASRAAFEASVQKLEQFMTLFPNAVRSLITDRVGLEEAPRLLKRAGGIKQVVKLAA